MKNAEINKKFLAMTDAQTRAAVLANIAEHYGITSDEAMKEVTHEDAELLLDYVTGPVRNATHVLMRGYGLVGF